MLCIAGAAGTASDVQPPYQAIPGLEVLYGGLGSLWRLPLQLSSLNDTLFNYYLGGHPLTARQNRTLAKPRPPTLPGFGERPTNAQVQAVHNSQVAKGRLPYRQGHRECCLQAGMLQEDANRSMI